MMLQAGREGLVRYTSVQVNNTYSESRAAEKLQNTECTTEKV